MKQTKDLFFGFNDAENFKRREHKNKFSKFFTRTNNLHDLIKPSNYFLVGDKGTGKTALAVYLTNEEFRNTQSSLAYIRETEYLKFITLKRENHLTLSDYQDIWKVILLMLLAKQIENSENENVLFSKFSKFKPLKDAIEQFYHKAFSPEIIYALNFVEDSKRAAEILTEYFKLSGENKSTESFSESRFQLNLLFIQKKFETALKSLNLEKNHILFIDGIDIRPRNVEYEEYLECVKGLVTACWNLNNDFLASIKGSKGRMKVVVLLRPDILASLGLQNINNKVKDNSVLLDWKTTYPKHRNSEIFNMIDNILNSQQSEFKKPGECWDYYFPYKTEVYGRKENPFVSLLRYSMFKPRDIISMLTIMHENFLKEENRKWPVFHETDFTNNEFRSKYADYLLGEIKDFLAFYHSEKDYELFLKFFEFLNGKTKFDYDQFIEAYDQFADYVEKNEIDVPPFFETSDRFLQFLYQLNIICFIEDPADGSHPFIRWCYRERSFANLNPKIKIGVRYEIHYGLMKAFNVGKKYKKRTIKKKKK